MRSLLVLLALLSASTSRADDFLRQLAATRSFTLGRPTRPIPTPDGKTVLFLRSPPRTPRNSLYAFDVASGRTRELLSPDALLKGADEVLSPTERAQRERMRISTSGFSQVQLSRDGREVLVTLSGKLYVVALADGKVTPLDTGKATAIDPQLSPDGRRVAYVHDRDLYVLEPGKKERRLTTSTDPTITNGLPEFVAMEELRRYSGFWWSGDGKSIAYEQADAHGVEQLHIADPTRPEHEASTTYYPRPGRANVLVKLGIIAATGGPTTWVDWSGDGYLVAVSWRDRAPLSMLVAPRDQKTFDVFAVDGRGKRRKLASEHDDAWLETDGAVMRWLPDGSQLLTRGIDHDADVLQLRDATGVLLRTLTRPEDGFRALVHLDGKRRIAWFTGGARAAEAHVYRVSLDGGPAEPLGHGDSVDSAVFNDDGDDVWIEQTMTASALPRLLVHAPKDGRDAVVGELPSVAEKPPFATRRETIQIGDAQFWVAITRPRDFDPKKRYPVIDSVYGGPTTQVARFSPALLDQWRADRGYIVVAIDGRGTPGRGHAWASAFAHDFSRTVDDQAEVLRLLGKKYPELDVTRVGVTGWSFGGYLSALAVLKRPDVFHAAFAGAPVVDWRDYDTAYTERYLGLPDENKAGYDASSLLSYADQLSRPLVIAHGTNDDNVYFFHTLKLVNALFRAGKRFEVLPIEDLTHMVPDPIVREQLELRVVGLFDSVLKK